MSATAGRVRLPANNRVHSSAALQTHGIWQSAIGYDPYAPNKEEKRVSLYPLWNFIAVSGSLVISGYVIISVEYPRHSRAFIVLALRMDRGKRPIVEDEDEEEPINIPEEQEVIDDTVSLRLLGKLWTNRLYNMYGLFETMKKIWCPTKGMICRDMGGKLISFQFHSKRDLERVLACLKQ